jgi:hypothetical protein
MNLAKISRAAAFIAISVFASQACLAQFESTDKSRIGIGVGIARPTGSKLRSIKSLWFGPTVDVHVLRDSFDRPTAIASIGWFGQDSGAERASYVPVKFTYIKRFNKADEGGWYMGGGLAVYWAKFEGFDYDPFTRSQKYVSKSGMPVGINILGGLEFGGAWYGELSYDAVTSLSLPTGSSVDFSGLSINFGSRLTF